MVRQVRLALTALLALIALAGIGPWFNPNGIEALDWAWIAAHPGLHGAHWFGTDRVGRDLFVRTLQGARVSLAVGALASAISVSLGVGYGAIAGYAGGLTDRMMMRGIEILDGLPLIFFVIFLTVVVGRGPYLALLAVGAVGWLTLARIVRGHTLSLRQRTFIEAAIVAGAGPVRVVARHVVPNLLGPVVAYTTLTVPQIILFESFLSFLGLGVQEPQASLGTLIAQGAGEMEAAPWMLWIPGGYLALLLASLHVLGDGLRDALGMHQSQPCILDP